jgi:hypothetical protein
MSDIEARRNSLLLQPRRALQTTLVSSNNERLRHVVRQLAERDPSQADGFDLRELGRLRVPDTVACRAAENACRDASSGALVNHCFRSFAWGVLLGTSRKIRADSELLYVAAMLHDLGLTPSHDRGGCFECDGADAARRILTMVGWVEPRRATVAEAIYLHMHDVDEWDSPEAQLLALGTAADVSGRLVLELNETARSAVLDSFPRNGFKREFVMLLREQAARKPHCVVAEYLHSGLEERILDAPFDD